MAIVVDPTAEPFAPPAPPTAGGPTQIRNTGIQSIVGNIPRFSPKRPGDVWDPVDEEWVAPSVLALRRAMREQQAERERQPAPAPEPEPFAPAATGPVGPAGRSFEQVRGTEYLSPEERDWFLRQQGRRVNERGEVVERTEADEAADLAGYLRSLTRDIGGFGGAVAEMAGATEQRRRAAEEADLARIGLGETPNQARLLQLLEQQETGAFATGSPQWQELAGLVREERRGAQRAKQQQDFDRFVAAIRQRQPDLDLAQATHIAQRRLEEAGSLEEAAKGFEEAYAALENPLLIPVPGPSFAATLSNTILANTLTGQSQRLTGNIARAAGAPEPVVRAAEFAPTLVGGGPGFVRNILGRGTLTLPAALASLGGAVAGGYAAEEVGLPRFAGELAGGVGGLMAAPTAGRALQRTGQALQRGAARGAPGIAAAADVPGFAPRLTAPEPTFAGRAKRRLVTKKAGGIGDAYRPRGPRRDATPQELAEARRSRQAVERNQTRAAENRGATYDTARVLGGRELPGIESERLFSVEDLGINSPAFNRGLQVGASKFDAGYFKAMEDAAKLIEDSPTGAALDRLADMVRTAPRGTTQQARGYFKGLTDAHAKLASAVDEAADIPFRPRGQEDLFGTEVYRSSRPENQPLEKQLPMGIGSGSRPVEDLPMFRETAPAPPTTPGGGKLTQAATTAGRQAPKTDLEKQLAASIKAAEKAKKPATAAAPTPGAATVGVKQTPRPAVAAKTVTLADGTSAPANTATLQDAAKRYLSRNVSRSGKVLGPTVNIPRTATRSEMVTQVIDQMLTAKTQGGRRLLQGVSRDELLDALADMPGDLVFVRLSTGPRGRIAARWQSPNPLAEAVQDAVQTGARGAGGAGGGGPRLPLPPEGGKQQPLFDWKPGEPLWKKAAREAGGFITVLPRALQTAFDYSYPLRQGGLLGVRHQKEFWPNFVKGFRSLFDADYARLRQAQIERMPYTPRTLHISPLEGGRFTAREEEFLSHWTDKIPGIKQSARAATVFINGLRADLADTFARSQLRSGRSLADIRPDLEAYGSYVSRATGRGNLGDLENSVGLLNQVFYSARRNVAMFQVPGYLFHKSAAVRKEAFLDFVTFFGVGVATLKLAEMAGADVSLDPMEADFGKIQVGNTRVDIWGGYQQMARLVYRIAAGQVKSPGNDDFWEPVDQFLRNKLAPGASFALDIRKGQTAVGEKIGSPGIFGDIGNVGNELSRRLVPLAWQGLVEAIREDGALGGALAISGFFGTGVQSYANAYEITDKAIREDIEKDLLPARVPGPDGNLVPLTDYNQLPRELKEAFDERHPQEKEARLEASSPAIKRLREEQAVYADRQANEIDQMPFGQEWRDARNNNRAEARGALASVERQFADYFADLDKKEPQSLEAAALRDYIAAIEASTTKGVVDWTGVDRTIAGWDQAKQDALVSARLNSGSAKEREYLGDILQLESYFEGRDRQWDKIKANNPQFADYATLEDYKAHRLDVVKRANPDVPVALLEAALNKEFVTLDEGVSVGSTQVLIDNPALVRLLAKHGFYVPAKFRALTPPAGQLVGSGR